jgi:hypothetical protein
LNSVLSGLDAAQLNAVLDAFSDEALVTGVQGFIDALDDGTATVVDATTVQAGLTARSNTASGLGLINTINDMLAQRAADAEAAAAAGLDVNATAGALYNQELNAALANTSLATLGAILDSGQITDEQTRAVLELRLEEEALAAVRQSHTAELDVLSAAYEAAGRRARTLRQAAESLYVDANLSPLSSLEQLEEARRQVEEAFALANDGTPDDVDSLDAVDRLPGLVRTMLELSRGYNASTEGYLIDFNRGQEVLNATASAQAAIETQMLARMTEIRDILGEQAANDNLSPADRAAASGFNFGADTATNRAIYNALVEHGLPTPSGFGDGQLGPLRRNNAAVDAVIRSIVGYNDGGLVTGGVQGRDSVIAALTPGERVLTVEQNRVFDHMAASLASIDRLRASDQAASSAAAMDRMLSTMIAVLDEIHQAREEANQNAATLTQVSAQGAVRVVEAIQENTAAIREAERKKRQKDRAKKVAA